MNYKKEFDLLLKTKEVEEVGKIKIDGRWQEYKDADYNLKLWIKFWKKIYQNDKSDKVLDFGCGATWGGFVARKFNLNNHYNLDIDTREVRNVFGKYAYELKENIKYYDGKTIPFDTDYFDAIVAKASIMKLEQTNLESVIYELARVSKKNATWYVASKGMCFRLKEALIMHKLSNILFQKSIKIKCWTWAPLECIRSKSPWTEFHTLFVLKKYLRKIKLFFLAT